VVAEYFAPELFIGGDIRTHPCREDLRRSTKVGMGHRRLSKGHEQKNRKRMAVP
jgi:hypothetical protein